MNRLLKKILYRNVDVSEYAAVTITADILEKVYLHTQNQIIDISRNQWVLCLEPLIVGIWIANEKKPASFIKETDYKLFFHETTGAEEKKLATLQLIFFDSIQVPGGILLLLQQQHCRLYYGSSFERALLFYRFYRKPGFTFSKFKSFAAAFSYPRKVKLISVKTPGHYNIFPMDLTGMIEGTHHYVFGLRHTNKSLTAIMETKKLIVSEVAFTYKKDLYTLGKHHSTAPPALESLPFKTINSNQFGFPVPEWVEKYNEIQITKTINLGSQMLLWGESQQETVLKPSSPHLYHIHFLLHLFQKRSGNSYPLA